ncbi:hypothetical protein [Streptomyces sp. MI02-7b]|uniref:hypothetical protein n=1 Tax=Streptomyces sp. MI02-7b TaxID=462941 RepID=UPI0029C9FF94|nr:hypothetical protein [Streptomyces sp. MI02-7b]
MNGEPEPLDAEVVREVLGPYVVAADEDFGDVLIRTADGYEVQADFNGVCIAVGRFPPGQFFDIVAELVDRLRAAVILTDRPPLLRDEADRIHLPGDAEDAVVVEITGAAIENFVSGIPTRTRCRPGRPR